MVYFQLNRLGFDCGLDKENCNKYPDYCMECVKNQLEKLGLDISQNIKITLIDSEEKRVLMFQDLIWQKFLDVLNLKHIILITIDSGLSIVNYPISGAGVNMELLTGFIQANVSFSETSEVLNDNLKHQNNNIFYEFQYQNFNILLKNGQFIRICLVLDHKASENLKTLVTEFLSDYESKYHDIIENYIKTGKLEFGKTIDFIIDTFNIKLVFPMILTHTILPDTLEKIKKNPIQKAILDFANEFLASKSVFFINNLLDKVQKIVNIDSSVILYEIYQILEQNVIIPTTIESAEDRLKNFKEIRATRIADNELISPIIANEDAINELKGRIKNLSENEARKLMDQFIKKAETAERSLVHKEAQKEYEKALYIATGFDFEQNIGKISFMVLELDKKIKKLELDYVLGIGEKSEKKKDYINAINYYKQGLKILDDVAAINENESKIKKLEKKISNLQKHL
ncbi:MAG: hypothetical protein ACFFHD_15745 [Promethearchaeota archaeon]